MIVGMHRRPRKTNAFEKTAEINGSALSDDVEEPPEDAALPRYRRCCRRIHRAYMAMHEGDMDPEVYRMKKENLLRRAVQDAVAMEAGPELIRMVETLRLATAVNEVELESVRAYFR